MNSKSILFLSLFAAITLATSGLDAAPHGGGHSTSMPMGGGRTFTRGGTGTWSGHRWNGGNWSGRNWNNWGGDWHHHHHHNNNQVIFIGDFGFPLWWGWGYPWWGWGYPYGYGYGYPPYGYGYGGYGYDYGQPGYGPYGGYGYGGYGNGSHSRVAELQRRLARAGYYHGAVDGIMGPATRRAIRSYERDRGYAG
ncbi:MAG: hypothetical protein DME91_03030 [Verrucomicrobia bacterium]|nr:MAG: hypothetical protein DME91_03030 [Verrucomicrobiota bacterium]PYJ46419.1 MAG: hypothetical protein DME85_10745 [Verrucomicrobiota bacterium]